MFASKKKKYTSFLLILLLISKAIPSLKEIKKMSFSVPFVMPKELERDRIITKKLTKSDLVSTVALPKEEVEPVLTKMDSAFTP